MKPDLNDLISRRRIRYELGESNMPKRYREFCLRVIDSERLTPKIFFNFDSQEEFTDTINELIALGKERGFSNKDILDAQIYSNRSSFSDFLKNLKLKTDLDAYNIKVFKIAQVTDKEVEEKENGEC